MNRMQWWKNVFKTFSMYILCLCTLKRNGIRTVESSRVKRNECKPRNVVFMRVVTAAV